MNEDMLAARHYLYRTFQCLLGNDPRSDGWAELDAELVEEACAIAGTDGAKLARLLGETYGSKARREQLASEYAATLVGPGALPSPPWESAQLSSDGGLFTPVTLTVRNAYRAQGLLPQQYPSVADDHIALECGFLAELAGRTLSACKAHDAERCTEALEASRSFIKAHPLRWAPCFAEKLSSEKAPFYRTVAESLVDFLKVDASWLDERALSRAAA
ncbi:molecular chaperone TorD family protein [Adlercreutzia sp. R21]|uniref:TorD/DmsD family molecular chaperone n=1 Tax=Adlercreutzia wanghongyangiae TaxID=3111451 RepID=UPI002DBF2397|nr:molecular chaperone TorD family protein [Adlercreutzia sp. R21]MEC4185265.1 molecular chaperone TorD family protein [Adlercreutzia sp. R21]